MAYQIIREASNDTENTNTEKKDESSIQYVIDYIKFCCFGV